MELQQQAQLMKRQREEYEEGEYSEQEAESKRQRSFNDLISILDDDEDEPNQDLSSLITSLQQELCSVSHDSSSMLNDETALLGTSFTTTSSDVAEVIDVGSGGEDDEEKEKEKVMRHLLEASDDELGIPNTSSITDDDGFMGEMMMMGMMDGGDFPGLEDGVMWEIIEDDAANCIAMFQSDNLFL